MGPENIENTKTTPKKASYLSFNGFYICPVCGFPGNFEYKFGEVCQCCKWQDDDIDDSEPSANNRNFSCKQYRHIFFNHIRNTKTESLIKAYRKATTKNDKFKIYTDWFILANRLEFTNLDSQNEFIKKCYHQANLYFFLKNLRNEFEKSEKNQYLAEDIKEELNENIFSDLFFEDFSNRSKIDKVINLVSKMSQEHQEFFVEFFICKIYRTIFNNPENQDYVYAYDKINNTFKIKTSDFHFIKGKLMSLSGEHNLHLRGNVAENLIKIYFKLSSDSKAKKALESIKWLQDNIKEGL